MTAAREKGLHVSRKAKSCKIYVTSKKAVTLAEKRRLDVRGCRAEKQFLEDQAVDGAAVFPVRRSRRFENEEIRVEKHVGQKVEGKEICSYEGKTA